MSFIRHFKLALALLLEYACPNLHNFDSIHENCNCKCGYCTMRLHERIYRGLWKMWHSSSETSSGLAIFAIIIAIGGTFFGIVLPVDKDTTSGVSLGYWLNMPSSLTEFMGNTSYRQTYNPSITGGTLGGLLAQLSVLCLVPSNTMNAQLLLQYAIYNVPTNAIVSGFQQLGTQITIDGSNNSCGSNQLLVGDNGSLNATGNQQGYVFRVMGQNGGGLGDNPRFSNLAVQILATGRRQAILTIGSHGLTTFSYQAQEIFAVSASTTITSEWSATNVTTTNCGVPIIGNTDHCWESGTTSATINVGNTASSTVTVTYTTAFTGSVNVVMTPTGAGLAFFLPLATITLFTAQTLTV